MSSRRSQSQDPIRRTIFVRMSFRRMEVGARFRRIKHNLQTKKTADEELKRFESIMLRNTKVANFANTYRKDIAATLSTGFKEENVDKRKKKVEELTLAQDLKEASVDLEYLNTSCLHHVINAFGTILHQEVDEKVKLEMALERRVHEEMAQFLDYEKNLNKMKDKLNSIGTDLEIAQKEADKTQKDSEKDRTTVQKDAYDLQIKYEQFKDTMVTDILASSASNEFHLNDYVLTHMQLKRDFFKKMWEAYDDAIPTVQSMIDNAVPRPVYGVALEEHLRAYREDVAVVIVKCCDFIRQHAITEQGIFRVNGNHGKIKRIKAAFDSGQFENDERYHHNDPHAIASALKSYLRDLPDPLTHRSLEQDWIKAMNKQGEERFAAIEAVLQKMSPNHRENLTYLIKFLCQVETHKEQNNMTASNLGIVFGPTITGMITVGINTFGILLIEFFVANGARIFGFTNNERLVAVDTSPTSAFSRAQSSISPRSFRPKEKAPPPPTAVQSSSGDLIDLQGTDEDDFSDDNGTMSSNGGSLYRSSTERRPNRPPPPSFRSTMTETPKSRPISYNLAVGARPQENNTPKCMTASMEDMIDGPVTPVAPERKRLSMMSVGSVPRAAQNSQLSSSQESSSGSLVTDGGDNRTLVSLDGELPAATSVRPNVHPPPQSSKPKPPLPIKPKDLSNESSRL